MVKSGGGALPKGTIFEFDYTGDVQTLELPKGNYLLEVWGGESGSYDNRSTGKGGYSKGVLGLKKDTVLNCYLGGKPSDGSSKTGGFNGGATSRSYGAAGGGGTDIRINSNSLYSRVIVAGGGGGNGYSSANPGGAGGGLNGIQGRSGSSSGGGGGTQTNGGVGYSNGIFGSATNSTGNGGAGGGGWYGGGAGRGGSVDSAGGGGSGYIHTPDSHKPSGWLLTEEHFLTDAETIAGNQTIPKPSGGTQIGHTGNGYARITVI